MFLANENFPRPSITLLRQSGFTILSIQEESPGISDEEVLRKATELDYIILTFDRDYGELIFRYQPANPPAVVYFRDKGNDPTSAGQILLRLFESSMIKFESCFTVIDKDNIRQRSYSSGA
jgi:predicted nuclease of predicted toxin-antitoxin system